jgi:hypothetical protein
MALREFKLPDPGEGLTEADLVTWHVAVGDTVKVNDIVVEVETAKSLVELPVPFAGTVAALHAAEGDTVEVGFIGHHPSLRRSPGQWGAVNCARMPPRRLPLPPHRPLVPRHPTRVPRLVARARRSPRASSVARPRRDAPRCSSATGSSRPRPSAARARGGAPTVPESVTTGTAGSNAGRPRIDQ